jgi:hypothetical protein
MKIEFHTEYENGIAIHFKVSKIILAKDDFVEFSDSGEYYPTEEAAVIAAMIARDCQLDERSNSGFHATATRMLLRMIGSSSAY